MPHELPKLPYALDALEPHVDARTMEIHHGKHHAAYVNNLNAALEKHPELQGKSLESTCWPTCRRSPRTSAPPSATTAAGTGTTACSGSGWRRRARASRSGTVAKAIDAELGGFDAFKEQFAKAAVGRFGSGWAWLTVKDGKLCVCSSPNQDNPTMKGVSECPGTAGPRPGRLGARVLPQVPEPPRGLHRRLVERGELGQGGIPVRRR